MGTAVENGERGGLRDRKKRQTRETIIEAAFMLFGEQGFQETTIRQIAEAADVAPRTVSVYFPVKEELVFCQYANLFEGLGERLEGRDVSETAADALRAWLVGLLAEAAPDLDRERSRLTRELVEADPALRIYERGLQERAEQIVAKAVAQDLGLEEDDLLPHMVGAATLAALDAIGRRMKESAPEDFESRGLALVDDVMTFIGAGVRGLADRRG